MVSFETNSTVNSDGTLRASIVDLLWIVRRRRSLFLAVVLLSTLLGIFLSSRPRKYIAEGTLRVQPDMASMYHTSPLNIINGDASDKVASEIGILQSRTLYLQVASELALASDPTFWSKATQRGTLSQPRVRDTILRLMRRSIRIEHSPKDDLITISCTSTDPTHSAKIVNTLINDYIAYLFKIRYGATQRSSEWLLGQLGDLKQQIEHDQAALTGLQGTLGIVAPDDKTSYYLVADSLNSLTKAASQATIERIMAEAKLRFLQGADPNLIEGEVNLLSDGVTGATQNSLLQNLRKSQAEAAGTQAKLLAQFGPNYPEVKQVTAQLAELSSQVKAEEARILNQARVSYNAAIANEMMTTGALNKTQHQASSSHNDLVRYALLLHDYEAHRALYEGLVQRLREAGITSGMEAGDIDIVDLADIPAIPIPPGPIMLIGASLFVGLLGAVFLAVAMEAIDGRLGTQEQAERASGLPLLSTIPHFGANGGTDLAGRPITISAPGSLYSESFQLLRTSILLARPGSPPQVILVCSSRPGEGKTTTAINLAITLAQHRARVLLVECDLRNGSIASRLGISPLKGLSNILAQQMSIDEVLHEIPSAGELFVVPSGPRPPNPAVLMGSNEMTAFIKACTDAFDFIVLDSAPILGMADTLNATHLAHATLLVVRGAMSSAREVRRARELLKAVHCTPVGIVLNDVELRAGGYGYGKYYHKYYRLGHEG